MVGVAGFEPAAFCSQSRRSSQIEPYPVKIGDVSEARTHESQFCRLLP
jgi:hypothetical protein